jgi:hypothetical protein
LGDARSTVTDPFARSGLCGFPLPDILFTASGVFIVDLPDRLRRKLHPCLSQTINQKVNPI